MGRLEEAQEIQKGDPAKAEAIYKEMISKPPGMNDAELREYELALVALGGIYRDARLVLEIRMVGVAWRRWFQA